MKLKKGILKMINIDVYEYIIKELITKSINVVVVSKNRKDTMQKIKNMLPEDCIFRNRQYSLELKNHSRVYSNTIDPRNLRGLSVKYVIIENYYLSEEIENFKEYIVPIVASINGKIFEI
jgi:hypothetical protein